MAERTRPIRIEFCVTEQERSLIQNKMAQLGTRNMGAYLRKMAIDGYIIKVGNRPIWPPTESTTPTITPQFASGWTRTANRSPEKLRLYRDL